MNLGLNTTKKTEQTVCGLNIYLANLHVLYTKLHNYHWNVIGFNFFDFHKKLEEMYNFISEEIDRIAERILMLGYKPVANLEDALSIATIHGAPSVNFPAPLIAQSVICDFLVIVNKSDVLQKLQVKTMMSTQPSIVRSNRIL